MRTLETGGMCVRHLYAAWWEFGSDEADVCPFGYAFDAATSAPGNSKITPHGLVTGMETARAAARYAGGAP